MGIFDWLFSGGSPVNTDGTPMIKGTGIDVKGHPYGMPEPVYTPPEPVYTPVETSFTSCDFSSGCGSDFNNY